MHKLVFYLIILFLTCFSLHKNLFAKADINFSGDVQYRIRFHYVIKADSGEVISAAPDFLNTYAWNLMCKIQPAENLFFGIRLSNPSGYLTDNISENLKGVKDGNYNLLSIPELYFNWTLGILSLAGGIIPVKGNTVLNLVAYEQNKYYGAGTSPWIDLMNKSQKGLNLGLTFHDDKKFTAGMDVVAAMANDAKGTADADAFILDQIRLILSFPTSIAEGKVTILPVMHLRTNVFRSADLEEANHSIAGGCDFSVNPVDVFGIKIGLAGGVYNNSSQDSIMQDTDGDDSLDTKLPAPQTSPLGILLCSGITLKPGFGKAVVDFNFSRSRDREGSPIVNRNLLFWDIKYFMPIKNLTIIPRVRIWYFTDDNTEETETRLRPELIFKAGF